LLILRDIGHVLLACISVDELNFTKLDESHAQNANIARAFCQAYAELRAWLDPAGVIAGNIRSSSVPAECILQHM